MLGTAALFVAGVMLAAFSPSYGVLVAARVVIGLAVGSASMVVPLYIGEVVPPRIRGALVSFNQLAITSGILASYLVDYGLASSQNWRLMFGLAAIPAILMFTGMLFQQESPHWLVAQGREDEAREVLRRVRGEGGRTVLPMTAGQIRAAGQAAVTPAQRLAIALAAAHAARLQAIRELTLDDIDLSHRRVALAGHRQRLGELTRHALLAWLGHRRATWPDTASRHVLVSRISALGTRPVSPDHPGKHRPRGVCLEQIRRDRILHEALATGADPLHLALVFNIDHTNAMVYANAARNLLDSPAEQARTHVATGTKITVEPRPGQA